MKIQPAILIVIAAGILSAQFSFQPAKDQGGSHFVLSGKTQWLDTNIDVQPGDALRFTATGSLQYPASKTNGPEGLGRSWKDLLRVFPLNEAGRGALIGRIGSSDAARPFLIGPAHEMRAPIAGRLYLGVNQTTDDAPSGSFDVNINRTAAPAAKTDPKAAPPAPIVKLQQSFLDKIPARVIDAEGTPGDRVNFLIVGSEDKVRSVLESAGWVKVDRSVKDTAVRAVLASLSKEAYTTLPMSVLTLFDRPQDYGYAQADPLRVVASRHHFRIWKAPFALDGQTVWAGAGTHDIGFDRDQRNNKITHKIDPDVDSERDYIAQSLQQTGQVALLDYMTPTQTVREAKTAHGEAFHSDGRTLVVYLQPDTSNFSVPFADLFCSVLRQNNPDTGDWGSCGQYLQNTGKDDLTLAALPSKYRVLVVPGIFSSCLSDTVAFAEGQKALHDKYGVSVEVMTIPNDSSEDNAHRIAEYLSEQTKTDPRKYIVVGYSKGTPDVQVALAKEPGVAAVVAAFITVAGATGGSPIADVLPAQVDRWVHMFHFGKCEGDLSTGMKSLRQDVRRAFLSSFPNPIVPTYSIVATSGKNNTSKALLESWQLLSAFDLALDGQLTKEDAIVPGAKYLGAALADHFAVALPFDKSADATIRTAMDHSRYPRAALLEALLRFVIQDIDQQNVP